MKLRIEEDKGFETIERDREPHLDHGLDHGLGVHINSSVHLERNQASYSRTIEEYISGKSLFNITSTTFSLPLWTQVLRV